MDIWLENRDTTRLILYFSCAWGNLQSLCDSCSSWRLVLESMVRMESVNDSVWVISVERKRSQVSPKSLPWRAYSFHTRFCNNGGDWQKSGGKIQHFVADECISRTDEKDSGLLVVYPEHYVLYRSHSQARTGWIPSLLSFTTSCRHSYLSMPFVRTCTAWILEPSFNDKCQTTSCLPQCPLSLLSGMEGHTTAQMYDCYTTLLPPVQRKWYSGGQEQNRHSLRDLVLLPLRMSKAHCYDL